MSDNHDMLWPEENPTRFHLQEFNQFLLWAYNFGCSDILIDSEDRLAVKRNGFLEKVSLRYVRKEEVSLIINEIFLPSATNLIQSGKPLAFGYTIMTSDESIIRFRVNASAGQGTNGAAFAIKMVFRTIGDQLPTCEKLQIDPAIVEACTAENGIALIVGATGSGKSTTIAALIHNRATRFKQHILTAEQPIEYDFKVIPESEALSRINQTDVGPHAHIESFPLAIADFLRRAPDAILLGEARDLESIRGAIRVSQVGHFVYTTVHANSGPQCIARMADEFDRSERKSIMSKLVDALRVILYQRLVTKLQGGRIALCERLIVTETMRRQLLNRLLVVDDITLDLKILFDTHGVSLLADAKEKFEQGLIPLTEYILIVNEFGSKEDVDIVVPTANTLLSKGILSAAVHADWIADYEVTEVDSGIVEEGGHV